MAWCLRHDHSDGNIVIDGAVSGLSQLGRAKDNQKGYLRFKFESSEEKKWWLSSSLSGV
jgi:hypothetical protein